MAPNTVPGLVHAAGCAQEAYERNDWITLCRLLHAKDHWRVLAECFERAAWFDIETDGSSSAARITCICGYRDGQVATFVQGENLQGFVDWLQDVELLVSFNGNSFDVPRVLRGFALPSLPCAHVDLRWVAYHAGCRGGLKVIERELGVDRPQDLQGVDGAEAVYLWEDWSITGRREARDKLLRYCAADVVGLKAVGGALLRTIDPQFAWLPPENLWDALGPEPASVSDPKQPPRQRSTPTKEAISSKEAERMKAFLTRARARKSNR